MRFIYHSGTLILSFLLIFLWQQTFLVSYNIQTLAILIIFYGLFHLFRRRRNVSSYNGGMLDVFILNTVIFLLIFATGGLTSWFFFLLYFLGFGITFIFEPGAVFIFAIGTVAVFIPQVLINGGSIGTYIQLGSFILISPLPYFFGREYRDREEQAEEIEKLEERSNDSGTTIAKDVEEVIKNEKKNLKPDDIEKLDEILEESENLRSETKK